MSRRVIITLWVIAAVVSAVLYAANLWFGELNQDEGWYLYAARMVTHGKLPYIDFASTQGPVMPFVYVLAQPLVGMLGVAGGRLFTAILGLACAVLAALLAARLVPPEKKQVAAFLAFTLVGVNVYQSYFTTIVKTYSLCGLFLTAGFLVLSHADGKYGWIKAYTAGIVLCLAAGTRISSAFVLPVVVVVLFMAVVQVRKWQAVVDSSGAGAIVGDAAAAKMDPFIWLWFALGALAAAVLIFLPFAIKAPAGTWFALVEYHAGRQPGSFAALLAYKAGFLSRFVQAYFVPIALLVAACVFALVSGRVKVSVRAWLTVVGETPLSRAVVIALWLSVAAVTAVHLCAPFPYEDYQVMVFPLFAVALSVMLAGIQGGGPVPAGSAGSPRAGLFMPVMVLLVSVACAFSSPVNQGWFIGQRKAIWWPLRKETPIQKLHRTAEIIRSITKPGDLLLTQDLYLAVECGLNVPYGMELGPFCYFPDWSRDKALVCNVLNRDLMVRTLLLSDAPVAAFSGYGLTIRAGGPVAGGLPAICPVARG